MEPITSVVIGCTVVATLAGNYAVRILADSKKKAESADNELELSQQLIAERQVTAKLSDAVVGVASTEDMRAALLAAVASNPNLLTNKLVASCLSDADFALEFIDRLNRDPRLIDNLGYSATQALSARVFTHSWRYSSVSLVKLSRGVITPGLSQKKNFKVVSSVCANCRLEHRYLEDGILIPELEPHLGFWFGGSRVYPETTANCQEHYSSAAKNVDQGSK